MVSVVWSWLVSNFGFWLSSLSPVYKRSLEFSDLPVEYLQYFVLLFPPRFCFSFLFSENFGVLMNCSDAQHLLRNITTVPSHLDSYLNLLRCRICFPIGTINLPNC